MLKKAVLFFFSMLVVFGSSWNVRADEHLTVSAKSAVVINADNGDVLYAKNEHERLPIASTTKIMTALLTLETAAENDRTVTITPEMVRVEGSSMGLKAGNRLSLKSLAEGMLSVSGNDAANSAAIAVAGSVPAFAEQMNQKARMLGLDDTHFVTPSGLDDHNHYSSAYDLAILARAALENQTFSSIVSQRKIKVRFQSPEKSVTYTNHNRMLAMYRGCNGVKTGFTKKSGRCLVSAAKRDGVRVIAVTLNAPNDWDDHKKLLDYGFSGLKSVNFDDSAYQVSVPVVGGEEKSVPVGGTDGCSVVLEKDTADNIKRVVELPRFVYAPVETGQVLGLVRYTAGSVTIMTRELVARGNVERVVQKDSFFRSILKKIGWLFRR